MWDFGDIQDIPIILEKRAGRGIGTTGIRYPSLDRGSNQQLFIIGLTKETIEVSTIILRSWNADTTM
jgi:hypothetical protein